MTELTYSVLVLDVDGTMTDGGIVIDDNRVESKRFDVADGAGVKYFQRVGGRVAILTGRASRVVEHRARELGIEHVVQGAKQKEPAFRDLCEQMQVAPANVAYMGDDLTDIPAMRLAGCAIAPANGVEEVRAMADWVTTRSGGHGAVREAVERLLRQADLWKRILERYGL
jgi:3-deoxy-D-manno-octulosonate 8-phosphate phosphatase (KDO 8-P phosphatase)